MGRPFGLHPPQDAHVLSRSTTDKKWGALFGCASLAGLEPAMADSVVALKRETSSAGITST